MEGSQYDRSQRRTVEGVEMRTFGEDQGRIARRQNTCIAEGGVGCCGT
jgi:hypothetical protein